MSETPVDEQGPRRRVPVGACLLLGLLVGMASMFVAPNLQPAPGVYVNEAPAVRSLRTIGVAQALFHAADKERDGKHDYATLAELGAAGIIDGALASGTRHGYVFEASYSSATPELLWFATATPVAGAERQSHEHFATNQEGAVFYSTLPIRADLRDCAMPAGARRVGR